MRYVGDAVWPGFFHALLEIEPRVTGPDAPTDLGVLCFPPEVPQLCNVYLLLSFTDQSGGPKRAAPDNELC
jgi:hypothetical protein